MNGILKKLTRQRPLITFIFIAFGFSWIFWLILPANNPGDVPVQFLGGAFGPALAAIYVSAALNPSLAPPKTKRRWTVFSIMLVVGSIVIWLSRDVLFAGDYSVQWLVSAAIAVLLAAYVVSNRYSRYQGVRELLHSITEWPKKTGWYLFVLLLVPICYAISMSAFVLITGRELPDFPYDGTMQQLPLAILAAFLLRLLFGGANEEPGWRGFVLPYLQERYSPLIASVILGVIWSLWHLPLHLNGVYSSGWIGLAQVAARIIMSLPFTLLMTWVYNRSKGNLPLVILLHASNNTTPQFLLAGFIEQLIILIIAIVVLVQDRMWRKSAGVSRKTLHDQLS